MKKTILLLLLIALQMSCDTKTETTATDDQYLPHSFTESWVTSTDYYSVQIYDNMLTPVTLTSIYLDIKTTSSLDGSKIAFIRNID